MLDKELFCLLLVVVRVLFLLRGSAGSALRVPFLLTSCDFAAGALGMLFAYFKLAIVWPALRALLKLANFVLLLCLEVGTARALRSSRTTFAIKACDFEAGAGAAGTRFVCLKLAISFVDTCEVHAGAADLYYYCA